MTVSVCVCLSVCDHISGTTRPIFTKLCVHVVHGRSSVRTPVGGGVMIHYVLPVFQLFHWYF